jgi:hypothetical protein
VKGIVLLLGLLLALPSNAAVLKSPQEAAKEAHLANINALLIFTSQEGLNTGLYRFTKVDADMQIYNLPFMYHFKSDRDFNLFLVGNVGYSTVFTTQEYASMATIVNSDSHIQTYTGGIGFGGRYKIREDLRFLAGTELIYSRSGANSKNSDPSLVDPITDPLKDFFGSSFNDNLSYKLFMESCYVPDVEYFKPYIKFGYKFFDTKSDMGFRNLTTFSSQSSLSILSIGGTSDPFAQAAYGHLTLELYANANYLSGDVVKTIQVEAYSKAGGVLYLYQNESPSWIERYFLELSSINADGLEGYNVGLGFSIDY